MNNGPAHSRQRGVALVVALIMLLAVTLIAVSASNLVQSNLKIVQNMESRDMVRAAAHSALEEAISSGRFLTKPDKIFDVSCEDGNQKCYDVNGDGTRDVIVAVAEPTCVVVQPIKNSDLDVFNSAAEASCYMPPAVYSMCANSVWEFRATAADVVTGASIVVRQGIGVLTSLNNIATNCPI